MAFSITSGRIPGAKKIVIYGPEGIGKSTLASQFPDPVFIDTEDSTKDMNVKRLDKPSSWQMLLDEVRFIRDNPTLCKTLVLDTADWAEQMEIDDLLKTNQKNGIEDFGYGKGYTYSAERFGKLLNLLTEVAERGVHIVMTAHAQLRKVELPEEMGAYDHWEMKTSKKVAPLIREWADAVLFLNYKVNVINIDNQGAAKGKNKAQGGRRVIHTNHTPFWDAKNRYGMPDELPLEYESIAPLFADQPLPVTLPIEKEAEPPKPQPKSQPASAPAPAPKADKKDEKKTGAPVAESKPVIPEGFQEMRRYEETPFPDEKNEYKEPDPRIPKALRDLMIADKIDEWEIQHVASARGYMTADTKVADYPDDFLKGWCIGFWPQLKAAIMDMRNKMEIEYK